MKLLWDLFRSFFKIGAFTFGGGLAMLPMIRRIAVEEKGWMADEEMIDCVSVCQSLPGVLAINSAIYIGNKTKGLAGAVFAAIGVILPSFCIIIVIVLFLGQIEDNVYVLGAFEGIKAASAGLILVSACSLGSRILKGKLEYIIALLAFLLVVVAQVSAIWAILMGGLVGYLTYVVKRKKGDKK